MNGWDITATAILGYLSVPLVSLATRRHWPDQAKWAIAAVLSLGFAVMEVWLHHDPLTQRTIEAAFALTFVAQQATWHLHLPGAGTTGVNEALLSVPASSEPPTQTPTAQA